MFALIGTLFLICLERTKTMLMCTRCKKRPAVVFVSNGVDGQPTQGLCLVCARELGIKPVNDIMEKMGITDEELEAATAQMTELMNLNNDNDEEEDLFAPGGAATLPVDQMLGAAREKTAATAGQASSRRRKASTKRSASTSRTSAPI